MKDRRFNHGLDGVVMEPHGHYTEDRAEASIVGKEIHPLRGDAGSSDLRRSGHGAHDGCVDQAVFVQVRKVHRIVRQLAFPEIYGYLVRILRGQALKASQLSLSIESHHGSPFSEDLLIGVANLSEREPPAYIQEPSHA